MFIASGKFNWSVGGEIWKLHKLNERLNQCKWLPTPQLIIQPPINTPRETLEVAWPPGWKSRRKKFNNFLRLHHLTYFGLRESERRRRSRLPLIEFLARFIPWQHFTLFLLCSPCAVCYTLSVVVHKRTHLRRGKSLRWTQIAGN